MSPATSSRIVTRRDRLGRVSARIFSRSACTVSMKHCRMRIRISSPSSVSLVDGGFWPIKSTIMPPCRYPLEASPAIGRAPKRCARRHMAAGRKTARTWDRIAGMGMGQSSGLGLRKFCCVHALRKNRMAEHLHREVSESRSLSCWVGPWVGRTPCSRAWQSRRIRGGLSV